MSTAYIEIPRRRPLWLALRGAQLLLLLPLGALQLAAVVAFTTTADEMTTAAWVVAGAAVALDVAAIVLAFLLPRRTFLIRDAASMLLRAQIVLSLVKLIGYDEVRGTRLRRARRRHVAAAPDRRAPAPVVPLAPHPTRDRRGPTLGG